jgi:hypothetical protein
MASSSRTTEGDFIEGRSLSVRLTEPGTPDKSGLARLVNVGNEQAVKTGNQNDFTHREDR